MKILVAETKKVIFFFIYFLFFFETDRMWPVVLFGI